MIDKRFTYRLIALTIVTHLTDKLWCRDNVHGLFVDAKKKFAQSISMYYVDMCRA